MARLFQSPSQGVSTPEFSSPSTRPRSLGVLHFAARRAPSQLRALLFLLRGGKENVVQDETVSGRVLVEREIGGRIADRVLAMAEPVR